MNPFIYIILIEYNLVMTRAVFIALYLVLQYSTKYKTNMRPKTLVAAFAMNGDFGK